MKKTKSVIYLLTILIPLICLNCSEDKSVQDKKSPLRQGAQLKPFIVPENADSTDSGLKYVEIKKGDGAQPATGQDVLVHYTGWLMSGKEFDSSLKREAPFQFKLGVGQVIPGWDEGVASMHIGGKRRLFIPYQLAYGERGYPPVIPPKAMLVFDVELLEVK